MPKNVDRPKRDRFEIYKGYSDRDSKMSLPASDTTEAFRLTRNEIIKDAQKIKEFRGDGTYALTSFLREVDLVLSFCTESVHLRNYVYYRVILNKIQGDALDVIRTLGTEASWDQIKAELINNFGVKESYFQLYHKALSLRNSNVSDYFCKLKDILGKLNEKFAYDETKPVEFCPKTNENVILRTFLDNIDPNLASVIISRNCKSIREGYNMLQTAGLIREKQKQNVVQNNNNNNCNNSNNRNSSSYFSKNFSQNHFGQKQNNSGQFRNFSNNHKTNSGNFRNNVPGQRWPSHSNHHQPNTPNSSGQIRRNQVEPMDVDHIEHEANFQLRPQKHIYR